MLTSWTTIEPTNRRNVLYLLDKFNNNMKNSRDLEAAIHASCRNKNEYMDKCQQIILNIMKNPKLRGNGIDLIVKTDTEMSKGTILEDIQNQSNIQRIRFEQMLTEKYELMNDKSYNTTLKCRRCGSSEVSWEQKQTRSADEASTVFCTCQKCNNRWTMR
tara:strand:- start:772 stop:1251 length:480 start_codon:yes stop_codon:yes gene_type:complete